MRLPEFHIGSGAHHAGVTIFPVFTDGPACGAIKWGVGSETHITETAEYGYGAHLASAQMAFSEKVPTLALRGDVLKGGYQDRIFANAHLFTDFDLYYPRLYGIDEPSTGESWDRDPEGQVPAPQRDPRFRFSKKRAPLGIRRLLHNGDQGPGIVCNLDSHRPLRMNDGDFAGKLWEEDAWQMFAAQYPFITCRGMNAPHIPFRRWADGPEGLDHSNWYEIQDRIYEWTRYQTGEHRRRAHLEEIVLSHSRRVTSGARAFGAPVPGQTGVVVAVGGVATEFIAFSRPNLYAGRHTDILRGALVDAELLNVRDSTKPAWASHARRLAQDAVEAFADDGREVLAPDTSDLPDLQRFVRVESNHGPALVEAGFVDNHTQTVDEFLFLTAYPSRTF